MPTAMCKAQDVIEKYNLPQPVSFCRLCVVSNQRPRIRFDEHGVCSACRYSEYKRTQVDWKGRERELKDLCDRFRKRSHRSLSSRSRPFQATWVRLYSQ